MTRLVTFESWDSPQREPPEALPPYRDGATISMSELSEDGEPRFGWSCPCGEEDPHRHSAILPIGGQYDAQTCLTRHLASAHGEDW